MTYTFDSTLADSISLVRFHIGDNHDTGHYIEDETITYLVTTHGADVAVIRAIEYIITQLSQPDFKQDWLSVSLKDAREGYEKLKKEKEQELGLSSGAIATSSVSLPSRADSYMTTSDQDGAP